jgi:hypothetical protein
MQRESTRTGASGTSRRFGSPSTIPGAVRSSTSSEPPARAGAARRALDDLRHPAEHRVEARALASAAALGSGTGRANLDAHQPARRDRAALLVALEEEHALHERDGLHRARRELRALSEQHHARPDREDRRHARNRVGDAALEIDAAGHHDGHRGTGLALHGPLDLQLDERPELAAAPFAARGLDLADADPVGLGHHLLLGEPDRRRGVSLAGQRGHGHGRGDRPEPGDPQLRHLESSRRAGSARAMSGR